MALFPRFFDAQIMAFSRQFYPKKKAYGREFQAGKGREKRAWNLRGFFLQKNTWY